MYQKLFGENENIRSINYILFQNNVQQFISLVKIHIFFTCDVPGNVNRVR